MSLHIDKYINDGSYYLDHDEIYLGCVGDTRVESAVASFYFNCLDTGGEDFKVLGYLFKFMDVIEKKQYPDYYTGEWYSIMFILEHNNLVECGVSIRFPWLTDRGKLAYEDINKVLNGEK